MNGEVSEDIDSGSDTKAAGDAWNSAFKQRMPYERNKTSETSRRIHFLGVGNIGLLLAHSLAGIPNRPPITFLTRSRLSAESFRDAGHCVGLVTDGISETRSGFDVEHAFEGTEGGYTKKTSPNPYAYARAHGVTNPELANTLLSEELDSTAQLESPQDDVETSNEGSAVADDVEAVANQDELEDHVRAQQSLYELNSRAYDTDNQSVITNLIVSVKVQDILAIRRIAHRLTKDSVIMFVQNGMGYIEEVNEQIFPDPNTRPNYIVSVVTHGAKRLKAYSVAHAGHGTIALTILPRDPTKPMVASAPSARYLLRTICRTPVLAAVQYGTTDLLQRQLEKLAVNCVINPITAIMDCPNGAILHNFHISRIMRMILAEISLVARSLPELHNVPGVQTRFDPGKLELYVMQVASLTSENISSMLHDVRNGRETEIGYINGYIIRRGEQMGIRCIMNYMLMQMLMAKQNMIYQRDIERLPKGSEDSLVTHEKK